MNRPSTALCKSQEFSRKAVDRVSGTVTFVEYRLRIYIHRHVLGVKSASLVFHIEAMSTDTPQTLG